MIVTEMPGWKWAAPEASRSSFSHAAQRLLSWAHSAWDATRVPEQTAVPSPAWMGKPAVFITCHVLGVFASSFINTSSYTASLSVLLECGTPTFYICQLQAVNTG